MKKKYWLAKTAKSCLRVDSVELDPELDKKEIERVAPWIHENEEDAREHIRLYIRKFIRDIDKKIEQLENERKELVNKLLENNF